jgi:hypothetical protein
MVGIAGEDKAKYSAADLMVLQRGGIGYRGFRVPDATGNILWAIALFFAIGQIGMLMKGRDRSSCLGSI